MSTLKSWGSNFLAAIALIFSVSACSNLSGLTERVETAEALVEVYSAQPDFDGKFLALTGSFAEALEVVTNACIEGALSETTCDLADPFIEVTAPRVSTMVGTWSTSRTLRDSLLIVMDGCGKFVENIKDGDVQITEFASCFFEAKTEYQAVRVQLERDWVDLAPRMQAFISFEEEAFN